MPADPPICPRDCDCERAPIQKIVVDEKTKRLELDVLATAVKCKLMEPK